MRQFSYPRTVDSKCLPRRPTQWIPLRRREVSCAPRHLRGAGSAVPDVRDAEKRPTTASAIGRRRVRFTSDIREIHLFRNGVEVVPIVPGRFCGNAADAAPSQPAGCFGLYQYLPSAFAPGADLELRVYSDDAPTKPRVWKVPAALIDRVWADFEPWLAVAACPAPCRLR